MINRLRIVSAFDRLRRLINYIQNTFNLCEARPTTSHPWRMAQLTWANKFKWKPVVQLFPRYFIPLSWATGLCQSGT